MIYGIDIAHNSIRSFSLADGAGAGGIAPPSGFTITTVATDAIGQLYVGGYTSAYDEILVYAAGSAGVTSPSASPIRTIQISGVSPSATAQPTNVAVDTSGNMYALIAGSTSVYELPANSSGLTAPRVIAPAGLSAATSITTDPTGNLYVLGSAGTSGMVDVFAASSAGATEATGSSTLPAVASGIAVDGSGSLYVLVGSGSSAQIEVLAAGSSSASRTLALPLPGGAGVIQVGSIRLDQGGNVYAFAAAASTGPDELEMYGFAPTGKVPFLNVSQSGYGSTTLAVY